MEQANQNQSQTNRQVKKASNETHFDPTERRKYCRIAIIGNVDSGKSTMVGVLSKGQLDDGNGEARQKVFNYIHEKQNGRTSSIAQEIMGFDKDGKQFFPKHFTQDKNRYWKEVVEHSSKVVKLLDLAGHEKYLKTTMFGLSGLCPDYCMVIIGTNMGIKKMTKEHLGIAYALNIPLFVVLTKIDICPENIFQETQKTLKTIIRKQLNRIPIDIKAGHKESEIISCSEQMPGQGIVPVFHVSAVQGTGVQELSKFMQNLENRDKQNILIKDYTENFEYDIHEHFLVKGVGVVISGLVKSGFVKVGQTVNLGPDKNRQFKQVVIKNIHIDRVPIDSAGAGELCCINIKPLKTTDRLSRGDFRKGMMLLDLNLKIDLVWEFTCEVKILHHATTIKPNYESVVHCGIIRQTAKLVEIYGKQELQNRDHGSVRMRFKFTPEVLREGQAILFREGRTKILGTVTHIFTDKEIKKEKLLLQTQKVNQNQNETLINNQQKPHSEFDQQNHKVENLTEQQNQENTILKVEQNNNVKL